MRDEWEMHVNDLGWSAGFYQIEYSATALSCWANPKNTASISIIQSHHMEGKRSAVTLLSSNWAKNNLMRQSQFSTNSINTEQPKARRELQNTNRKRHEMFGSVAAENDKRGRSNEECMENLPKLDKSPGVFCSKLHRAVSCSDENARRNLKRTHT